MASKKTLLWVVVGIVLVAVVAGGAWAIFGNKNNSPASNTTSNTDTYTQQPAQQQTANATKVSWGFNGSTWTASGTPPSCPNPLDLASPVDLSKATAILYPGQTRGGNYKPHGGFLFGNNPDNAITVTAPMDATVVHGSRYIEQGEVQYLLFFVNPCGIAYRFDHLLTLSPAMQALADTLPAAEVDDSRTTPFTENVTVHKGDVIATAVGFAKTHNVSVDFGVYDLRKPNDASKNASYAAAQGTFKEQTFYAQCWLTLLDADASARALSLPGGDQSAGKTSDYCK